MNKFTDLTGQRFDTRTVLGFSHQHPKSRNLYWKTVCDCGYESAVKGSNLRGKTRCKSCAARESGRKGLYKQSEGLSVYFILCGKYVKVGCSSNIKRRVNTLRVYNPEDVQLLKVCDSYSEEYWHNLLKSAHHKGEWYHLDKVLEIVDLT